jgi:hypothetical protein
VVYLGNRAPLVTTFTDAIRTGVSHFNVEFVSSIATASIAPMFFAGMQPSFNQAPPQILQPRSDLRMDRARTLMELTSRTGQVASRSAIANSFGGGSSSPAVWLESIRSAWDELAELWDGLDREIFGDESREEDDQAQSPAGSQLLRVGRVVGDFFADIFGTAEEGTSPPVNNDRRPAQPDGEQLQKTSDTDESTQGKESADRVIFKTEDVDTDQTSAKRQDATGNSAVGQPSSAAKSSNSITVPPPTPAANQSIESSYATSI